MIRFGWLAPWRKTECYFPRIQQKACPWREIIETTLRMSKLGLIDAFEQARLDKGVNLLVVVDQFEELFRYRSSWRPPEPTATNAPVMEAAALVASCCWRLSV